MVSPSSKRARAQPARKLSSPLASHRFSPSSSTSRPRSASTRKPDITTQILHIQSLLTKRQSTGSYSCEREVLHPLDPQAEPGSFLFYDSDDSEVDLDQRSPRRTCVDTFVDARECTREEMPDFLGKALRFRKSKSSVKAGSRPETPLSDDRPSTPLAQHGQRGRILSPESSVSPVSPSPRRHRRRVAEYFGYGNGETSEGLENRQHLYNSNNSVLNAPPLNCDDEFMDRLLKYGEPGGAIISSPELDISTGRDGVTVNDSVLGAHMALHKVSSSGPDTGSTFLFPTPPGNTERPVASAAQNGHVAAHAASPEVPSHDAINNTFSANSTAVAQLHLGGHRESDQDRRQDSNTSQDSPVYLSRARYTSTFPYISLSAENLAIYSETLDLSGDSAIRNAKETNAKEPQEHPSGQAMAGSALSKALRARKDIAYTGSSTAQRGNHQQTPAADEQESEQVDSTVSPSSLFGLDNLENGKIASSAVNEQDHATPRGPAAYSAAACPRQVGASAHGNANAQSNMIKFDNEAAGGGKGDDTRRHTMNSLQKRFSGAVAKFSGPASPTGHSFETNSMDEALSHVVSPEWIDRSNKWEVYESPFESALSLETVQSRYEQQAKDRLEEVEEVLQFVARSDPNVTGRTLLAEFQRLRINTSDVLFLELEKESINQEKEHLNQLQAAAAKHNRVRCEAETTRDLFQRQLELEEQKRREVEKRELDRQRQAKADLEIARRRAEIERVQKEEAEKAALEKQRIEDEAKARKAADAKKIAVENARAKVEAERRAREKAEEDKKAQALVAQSMAARGASLTNLERESDHPKFADQAYNHLHCVLKGLRSHMNKAAQANPVLKAKMGDMRREIKKTVGQVTTRKDSSKEAKRRIIEVLDKALKDTDSTQIDVRQFFAVPDERTRSDPALQSQSAEMPALFIYLLNIFSKAVIAQFIDEAGVAPKQAEPVGILAVSIFATNKLKWRGSSFIDILIAKFCRVCPVLFGAYGDEKTKEGRRALGWASEDGVFCTEQVHAQRMTGLGAGFASISLRNFTKSNMETPFANYRYWQSLQWICSLGPSKISDTHFIVLKAMIENSVDKFVDLYADAAKLALRKALITLPQEAHRRSPAVLAVSALADVLKKDHKIYLNRSEKDAEAKAILNSISFTR